MLTSGALLGPAHPSAGAGGGGTRLDVRVECPHAGAGGGRWLPARLGGVAACTDLARRMPGVDAGAFRVAALHVALPAECAAARCVRAPRLAAPAAAEQSGVADGRRGDAVRLVASPFGVVSPELFQGTLVDGILANVLLCARSRRVLAYVADMRSLPGCGGGGLFTRGGDLLAIALPPFAPCGPTPSAAPAPREGARASTSAQAVPDFVFAVPASSLVAALSPWPLEPPPPPHIDHGGADVPAPAPPAPPFRRALSAGSPPAACADQRLAARAPWLWFGGAAVASGVMLSRQGHIGTVGHAFDEAIRRAGLRPRCSEPAREWGADEPVAAALERQLADPAAAALCAGLNRACRVEARVPSCALGEGVECPRSAEHVCVSRLVRARVLFVGQDELDVALLLLSPDDSGSRRPLVSCDAVCALGDASRLQCARGAAVRVVGHPLDARLRGVAGPFVTRGTLARVVSGPPRAGAPAPEGEAEVLVTTAAVFPGNSGGPLMAGGDDDTVLGIVTHHCVRPDGRVLPRLNFVLAAPLLRQLLAHFEGGQRSML